MSLLPVTEAIQRLTGEGLLESRPQVGTRVRIPSERDVREGFVVREALETQSARLFCQHATGRQRDDLKQMAENLDVLLSRREGQAADAGLLYAIHGFHLDFHMRIAEHSGCAALRELIDKNNVLVLNWIYDMAGAQSPPPAGFHIRLAAQLCGGDPDSAVAAMREHVGWGIEQTLEAIRLTRQQADGRWRLRGQPENQPSVEAESFEVESFEIEN